MKRRTRPKPSSPSPSDFREALEKHVVPPRSDALAEVASALKEPPVAKPSHSAILASIAPAPSRHTAMPFDYVGEVMVWMVILPVGAFFLGMAGVVAWESFSMWLPIGDSIRRMLEASS